MVDEHGAHMDAAQPDDEWRLRCAVIRITPGDHHSQGWPDNPDPTTDYLTNTGLYVHANAGHINVGITGVLIQKTTGMIRVDTDGAVNGVPLVVGDETAAAARLIVGTSGGNGHIHIRCSTSAGPVNLASQSAYNAIADPALNLWIAWLSPLVRGVGQPSKPDRALDAVADLEMRVTALEEAMR